MLTFGTGIGSALFTDGLLVPNTEFGHIEIRGKDAETRASERAREVHDLSWENWAGRVDEYLSAPGGAAVARACSSSAAGSAGSRTSSCRC